MEHPESHEEWIKSPDFCFHDGTIWLRAEKTLYCVHSGLLQSHSEVFQSFLTLPGTDGDCEQRPVFLPSISSIEFDYLCTHLFVGWKGPPPYEPDMLISLLKLSALYLMPSVRDFAKHHIANSYRIGPAIKIELARKYSIPEWVAPAFKSLVERGPSSISLEDAEHLGLRVHFILAQAQAQINEERTRLSLVASPVIHGYGCNSQVRCELAWKEFWMVKVSRWLINPDDTPRIADICSHIETLLPISSMESRCQQQTLAKLRGMLVLKREETITKTALDKVLEYHQSLEL